jgi:phosphoglycerate dehydrogenase-like enzyme
MTEREAQTVLAHLGGFDDVLLPVLQSAVPEMRFVACPADGSVPSERGEVLLTLLNDNPRLEGALEAGVRWIHVLGAGVDGFPFELAGDRTVTCSRGASSVAIAEFVLAEMLAFEKQLPDVWITAPPERWNVAALGGLAGRTLAVVGLGAIGIEVARRALAFDMRVVAVRRRDRPSPLPGVELTSFEKALSDADHVVVSAPSTPETRHLIGADAFAAMKPGVHLVNIARGPLVDQDALLVALDNGKMARASLDVADPEPLPAGHPLYTHPKVRLSPHVSWSSPDTTTRTIELFVENLRRWRAGEPLEGTVDVAAGY